jgi:lactate permease
VEEPTPNQPSTGDVLRRVLPWSLGLLLVMCLIVAGQSSPVLDWMLP